MNTVRSPFYHLQVSRSSVHLHLDVLSSNLLSYKGATLLKLQLEIQAVTSNIHLHSGKADGFLCDNILKIFALLKLYKSRDLQNGELSIHLFITIQCLLVRILLGQMRDLVPRLACLFHKMPWSNLFGMLLHAYDGFEVI